jgi:hypothetical protein
MAPHDSAFHPALADTWHDPTGGLLAAAGDVAREHVLIIGRDNHGLIDALACRGAAEVVLLGPRARPEPESVDLVLVCEVGSLDYAHRAIALARHALAGTGRIALRITPDAGDDAAPGVCRILRDSGFCSIDARHRPDGTIACAELPLFGSPHPT